MPRISPLAVALGIGPSLALVEITNYVRFVEGLSIAAGQLDQFRDTGAGTVSYVVENYSGQFTPNNPNVAFSPTTLAASASVGATSVSSTAFLPTGALVVLDTGVNAELVVTGTATGTGPFTIPVVRTTDEGTSPVGLLHAHSSGAAVNPMSTMTEGLPCTVQVGTRVDLYGTITIELPSSEADTGLLTITCDDQLGVASRQSFQVPLAGSMVLGSKPYLYYPMNDAAGSVVAVEQSGNAGPNMVITASGVGATTGIAFGATGVPAVIESQLQMVMPASTAAELVAGNAGNLTGPVISHPAYPAGSLGFLGCWITPGITSKPPSLTVSSAGATLIWGVTGSAGSVNIGVDATSGCYSAQFVLSGGTSATSAVLPVSGVPVYLSAGVTYSLAGANYTYVTTLYINGVSAATSSFVTTTVPPTNVAIMSVQTNGIPETAAFSHLSHTPTLVREELAGVTTEALRLQAIDSASPGLVLGSIPSDLATSPVGIADGTNQAVLDGLNELRRTEQGYMWVATTGTLLTPTATVQFRARQRPQTSSYSFNAITELGDYLQFVRDVTNLASITTAAGPDVSATYTDATLTARVGSANVTESVLLEGAGDLYSWASDRSARAAVGRPNVVNVTVDALSTPTDRSANLLAMTFGDRITITNIPSATTGFSTWDGFFIGRQESHTLTSHTFTLFLAPCPPLEGLFDQDRLSDNGELSLSAAITTLVATSCSVATTGTALTTNAGDLPAYLQIDQEIVQATNITGATPQVLTIVRGQLGSIAATHSSGAPVTVYLPALYGL